MVADNMLRCDRYTNRTSEQHFGSLPILTCDRAICAVCHPFFNEIFTNYAQTRTFAHIIDAYVRSPILHFDGIVFRTLLKYLIRYFENIQFQSRNVYAIHDVTSFEKQMHETF